MQLTATSYQHLVAASTKKANKTQNMQFQELILLQTMNSAMMEKL